MYLDHIIAGILLVSSSILISYTLKLQKEREIFLSSLRVAGQLLLLGFLFNYIFGIESIYGLTLIILIMTFTASLIAMSRIDIPRKLITSFISILITTFIPLIVLVALGVIEMDPYHVIPIGGLMLGNALNSITLAVDKLKSELKNRLPEIEGKVALGADIKTAMRDAIKDSIKTAIIPKINMLQSAGIVHIPGITVGMLMAGADPFTSVIYQLTILYLILFIGIFSGYVMLEISYRDVLLSSAENLRK